MAESSIILFALFYFYVHPFSFFSASETAYSSVNKYVLFVKRDVKALKGTRPCKDFNKTISAILIGGNIVDIVMTSAARHPFCFDGTYRCGLCSTSMTVHHPFGNPSQGFCEG